MRMFRIAIMTVATPAFLLTGAAVGAANASPVSVPTAGCVGASGQYVCLSGAVGVDQSQQTNLLSAPTDACIFVQCWQEGDTLATAPVGVITPGVSVQAPLVNEIKDSVPTVNETKALAQQTVCEAEGGYWETYPSGHCVM